MYNECNLLQEKKKVFHHSSSSLRISLRIEYYDSQKKPSSNTDRDCISISYIMSPCSFSRRLRLIIREEEKHDNLFARLSPTTASNLHLLARRSSNSNRDSPLSNKSYSNDERPKEQYKRNSNESSEDSWMIPDEEENNISLSFLPLSIILGDNVTIYASYNGGSCEQDDIIEIPRSIVSGLVGIPHNLPEFVSVHALSCVEHGTRVLVEPVTVEDWELLEIYSDFVEQGGLLSQVSVIYQDQNLTLRVGDGIDRVKVKVTEATGSSLGTTCAKEDSIRPLSCVLLIQDTEVIVSPKARSTKKVLPWSSPLRLIASDIDWGTSCATLSRLTNMEAIYVEPGCVLVHCDQWPFESRWARIKPENPTLNQMRVVRVTTSSKMPPNDAVLFIGTRLDLCSSIFLDRICLRPLAFAREESLERIILKEIRLKVDRTSLPTWNIPDIDLAYSSCERSSRSSCIIQSDQVVLPVGAVIPIPTTGSTSEEMLFTDQWCRITLEGIDDFGGEGYFVQLNVKDIIHLWKKRLQQCKGLSSTLVVQPSDSILRPREIVMSSNWTEEIIDRMRYFGSTSLTVSGTSGSGKTHNALLLSALISFYFHRPMLYLDCKKLQKTKPKMSGILEEIDSLFTRARKARNVIIVLDDLDKISPNLLTDDESDASARTHSVNSTAIDQSKLIADRLSQLFEAAERRGYDHGNTTNISLIVTCPSADSINPSILKYSRARLNHVKVPVLSSDDRVDFLIAMICRHHTMSRMDFDRSDISQRTDGFLPRDLEKISLRATRSFQTNSLRASTCIQNSLVAELAEFTPLAQLSTTKDEGSNNSSWADVGGLFDVKEKLESTVRHPVLYRRIYEKAQIKLPRGILLYGPSGCGKSFLIPALARECNYPIVTCKGPEILNKYIGASEANVRELFDRASQMAPSILFLDELEALAPRRGSDSTGVTDRVVNQLLTFLDGVEDVSSGTVFIIGATSRPDKVDPAIIRPGRLEQHLYVGPPESTNEWSDLLLKIAKNWNLKPESLLALSNGEAIARTVNDIPRLCPADVRAAFDTAHLNAVHRTLAGDIPVNEIEKIEIEIEDLQFGFRQTRPSLSESEARLLHPIYNSFRGEGPEGAKTDIRPLKTSLR